MRIFASRLLLLCVLLSHSVFFIQAQKRVRVVENSDANKETTNASVDKKTPVLVLLSRKRRAVDLPINNELWAERVVNSLERNNSLDVSFDPVYTKLEVAQEMIRQGKDTYVLMLRFDEQCSNPGKCGMDCIDDSNKIISISSDECGNDYKLEYTILAPKTGEVIKKGSIQTFFSRSSNTKPLFHLFSYNCVNTSRYELVSIAADCMATRLFGQLSEAASKKNASKVSDLKRVRP